VTVNGLDDPRSRHISDVYRQKSKDEPKKSIFGKLEISGLPPGYVAEPSEVQASLKLSDGTVITHRATNTATSIRKWDANVVQHALGGAKILNPEKDNTAPVMLLSVKDDLFGKYSAVPGQYDAEVEFVVKRYDAVGSLQVKPKARYDRGTEHAVITQVLKQTGAATVLLRQSEVSLFLPATGTAMKSASIHLASLFCMCCENDKQAESPLVTERNRSWLRVPRSFPETVADYPFGLALFGVTDRGQALTELNDMWLPTRKSYESRRRKSDASEKP